MDKRRKEETTEKATKKETATLKRINGYPQESESIVLPISFNLSSTHSYALSHGDVMGKNGW